MKIAVVGAGLAGLAAASFLKQDGHDVTVFERSPELKGRGLGIMVQPLGLSVLKQLGVLDKVIATGTRIDHMGIDKIKKNKSRVISDLAYKDVEPDMFAVGIHRPRLFDILLDQARQLGVNIISGCDIRDAVVKGDQRQLLDASNTDRGSFDLVIDASGYKSPLREKYATITHRSNYVETAICGTIVDDHSIPDGLHEKTTYRYDGDHALTLIPTGKDLATGQDLVSFFWVTVNNAYNQFDLDAWKKEVLDFMPAMQPYLDQVTARDQLVFAHYSDIALKTHSADKMAFIGDAAHSTSPLLAQSSSMGFVDALVLAKSLKAAPTVQKALETYSADRKNHVKFQQDNSRMLSRIFGAVSAPVRFYRDHLMSKMLHIPGQRKTLTLTTARAEKSLKKSLLRNKYGI